MTLYKKQTCYYIFIKYKLILITQMQAILKPKSAVFEQLLRNLEMNCSKCYKKYDNEIVCPMVMPYCRHHYCQQCIHQIFKEEQLANCPKCQKLKQLRIVHQDQTRKKIIKILKKYKKQQNLSYDQIADQQKAIATQFSKTFEIQCQSCQQIFDSVDHIPVLLCSNDHVFCKKCIKERSQDFIGICPFCEQAIKSIQRLSAHTLLQNIAQFVRISLYKKQVFLIYDDHQYKIRVGSIVSIKNIFHFLQDQQNLPENLQIKDCRFYLMLQNNMNLQESKEIQPNLTMEQIDKIINKDVIKILIKPQEKALKKGVAVTKSSKILTQLPIKINNFQNNPYPLLPVIQIDFDQEDQLQIIPEQIQSRKIPAKIIIRNKQMPIFDISSINLKQKEKEQTKHSLIPGINSEKVIQVSKSQLKMIFQSQMGASNLSKDRSRIRSIKSSIIAQRRNQMQIGSSIQQSQLEKIITKASEQQKKQIIDGFIKQNIMQKEDEIYICFKTYQMVNKILTKEEQNSSQALQEQVRQKSQQNDLLCILLTILKKQLQDGQIEVFFSKQSTQNSKLSLKIITSHYLSNRMIVKLTQDQDQQWFFEKIYDSSQKLQQYIMCKTRKLSAIFNLNYQDIIFHNISKGQSKIISVISINNGQQFSKHLKNNLHQDIQLHPFFTKLTLSLSDFTDKGKINFPSSLKTIFIRGNWPYYQPINSIRYGINVLGMFDQGDDTWLMMKGTPGQWAVGFHAVRNPNKQFKNYKHVTQSILASLRQNHKPDSIVLQGQRESYIYEQSQNKKENVGSGIRLTPSFYKALNYAEQVKINEKSYFLVFQCRIKPSQIRVRSFDNNDWIVGSSKHIRPYGIVIITKQHRDSYPTCKQQFGQEFKYSKYNERIEKNK